MGLLSAHTIYISLSYAGEVVTLNEFHVFSTKTITSAKVTSNMSKINIEVCYENREFWSNSRLTLPNLIVWIFFAKISLPQMHLYRSDALRI